MPLYSVTYAVFDGNENCIARGNAPTLERAKELADKPKNEPLLRTVIETNGTSIIRHSRKPGRNWEESEPTGRAIEQAGLKDARTKTQPAPAPETKASPRPSPRR